MERTPEKLDKIIEFHTYDAKRGGWSEWNSPKMKGYKMKCCQCGLVHDIEFQVVRFVGTKDKSGLTKYEPVKNKNIQVLWRLRREV
jgi:hypothetical protein